VVKEEWSLWDALPHGFLAGVDEDVIERRENEAHRREEILAATGTVYDVPGTHGLVDGGD